MTFNAAPINPRILEEAAEWLMQLHASSVSHADREACARWREADSEHARAWVRAELLMNKLGDLPSSLTMATLDRPINAERRAAIVKLATLLAIIPAGFITWRASKQQIGMADHRTAVGERKELQLADGTQVTLNTDSAINVIFDETQRMIVLREGEILVRTAHDTAITQRPFRVLTTQGRLEALGTFFSVRKERDFSVGKENDRIHLVVLEGAVRIEPSNTAAEQLIVQAGQKSFFTATRIAPVIATDTSSIAWTRGMLMADNMRLKDFITELARYREGFIRCDSNVADIRISGSFPLNNTDQALAMLGATYPVVALTRLHGYWVTVVAKE